ncbi:MAG: alginate lyase family protein [Acidobacteriota bacterium]
MKYQKFSAIIFSLAVIAGSQLYVSAQTAGPRVFLLSAKTLRENKQKLADPKINDPDLKAGLAKLERNAQKALKTEVLPITSKSAVPPSGDKHDYVSQAPYFWKNPDTKDGLPYIKKDGQRNPEIKSFPDHDLLDKMEKPVKDLAAAYYFTGKEEYAAKAAEILRMWFLDPKTLMNPNLEYAQFVPGQKEGRNFGIIETREITRVLDSVGLLNGSKSWTKSDQAGIEAWFDKYFTWLTTSSHGKDEARAKNNHGTWYDVQVTAIALFLGKTDAAKKTLESAEQNRIAKQIEPDGSEPLELARTKSWSYSVMNLEGLVNLALLGDAAGVNLWDFQTKDGRSIRRAVEFLMPYTDPKNKWTREQIEPFKADPLFAVVRRTSGKYTDDKYAKILSSTPRSEDDSTLLLGY